MRRREREVALRKGDFLSNLDLADSNEAVKYFLGGAAGRAVAETAAYLEGEMEGTCKDDPVAVTVWENERRSVLPAILQSSSNTADFSSQNLTFMERENFSDNSGAPKNKEETRLLPGGWEWQGNWKVILATTKDEEGAQPDLEGWQYMVNWGHPVVNVPTPDTNVRRRRWARVRVPTAQAETYRQRVKQQKMEVCICVLVLFNGSAHPPSIT